MSSVHSILVVDDEEQLCRIISQKLELEGFQAFQANDGQAAIQLMNEQDIDVVVLDYRLPDMTGIDLLEIMKKQNPQIPVIMLTAYGQVEHAVKAMKLGAYDYLNKPVQLNVLKEVIDKACENRRLKMENQILKEELKSITADDEFVFQSMKMKEIIYFLEKILEADVNILILGESGVGKTALAKWIHRRSRRRDKPFVSLNCAAIPPSLLESELFGYRKGAFTGATESRPGKFEMAEGGTIFLDEIGEIPPEMQAKLLHVIEEKRFMRLGSNSLQAVDVRIISATNKNLEQLVEERKFREDLYYRLNLAEVKIPPLRERPEDIVSIVQNYLRKLNGKYGKSLSVSGQALEVLLGYPWKGNVRELLNVLERIHILKANGRIEADDIPNDLRLSGSDAVNGPMAVLRPATKMSGPLQEILEEVERQIIQDALEQTGGNQTKAADILGISRPTLIYKMKKIHHK